MLENRIISTGLHYLGTPYVFNAPPDRTDMFDCSSFMQYIFGVNGIKLPRNSRQQFQVGVSIPFSRIKRGDLLFFKAKPKKNKLGSSKVRHVGVYLGNGQMLHTYRQGKKVTVSDLEGHWEEVFVGAKRIR